MRGQTLTLWGHKKKEEEYSVLSHYYTVYQFSCIESRKCARFFTHMIYSLVSNMVMVVIWQHFPYSKYSMTM